MSHSFEGLQGRYLRDEYLPSDRLLLKAAINVIAVIFLLVAIIIVTLSILGASGSSNSQDILNMQVNEMSLDQQNPAESYNYSSMDFKQVTNQASGDETVSYSYTSTSLEINGKNIPVQHDAEGNFHYETTTDNSSVMINVNSVNTQK